MSNERAELSIVETEIEEHKNSAEEVKRGQTSTILQMDEFPYINKTKAETLEELTEAYSVITNVLARQSQDPNLKANLEGTDKRAAKALLETCKPDEEIRERIEEIVKSSFPVNSNANSPVTQGPIRINSVCPHHLMPVVYEAYVSYLPATKDGQVLGLSKLARLCKELGRRPVLHEQLASDIVDVLYEDARYERYFPSIRSEGSAVSLVGAHTCMVCRGINSDSLTSIQSYRGRYNHTEMETRFLREVSTIKSTKLV